MTTGELPNQPSAPPIESIGYLDRDHIEAHLDLIARLDADALLDTLVPHRHLPFYDPASYLMGKHNELVAPDDHTPRDSYDLGIVFARSLLMSSLPADALPPVIPQTDDRKLDAIDAYIKASRGLRVSQLVRNDVRSNAVLQRAVTLFSKRCEVILPQVMLDGTEEVLRGCHDYISVCTLLETEDSERPAALRQTLGRLGLSARFSRLFAQKRPA